MKFLQVHVFYEQYLQDFYHRYPHLKSASYNEQISALVRDGFSAGHIYAPYMEELGYESQLAIANAPYAQVQWAKERGFSSFDGQNWVVEIVRQQIETFQPDILHFGHPMPPFDSKFLATLSWQPSLVIGWRAAPISKDTDWSRYDIMLSSSTDCRQQALQLGARSAEYFFPGIPQFIADTIRDQPKQWDVVFSGQWSSLHSQRNQYLQEIAKAPLGWGGEFSIGYFLSADPQTLPAGVAMHNQGSRWGIEMYRALKSGKIVINGAIDMAKGEGPNMRLFEATATGSFLLTEHQFNLDRFFEIGKEIETFKDVKEAIDKIYYYLRHPEEREAIARRGQERCLRDYSMQQRGRALDTIVKKYLQPSPKLTSEGESALLECRSAIVRTPDNAQLYRKLADLLRDRGKLEAAKRAYKRANLAN